LIAAHGAEGAGAAAATAEASGAAHTGGFGARGYGARALEPVFGLHAAQMMTMNEKNISCYAKKHWVETLHFLGHFFEAERSRAATTLRIPPPPVSLS
jgi:hypothetical protein